jgi:hypothetical protein
MADEALSCVQTARGPVAQKPEPDAEEPRAPSRQQEVSMIAHVGKEAPDFEASAYLDGGFRNVKLSDYRGQWVVICFYPGDFTFV